MKTLIVLSICSIALGLSSMLALAGPAAAVKVVEAVRGAAKVAKAAKKIDRVVDGASAVRRGRKVYRAFDVLADGVKLGKGMLGKLADSVPDDVIKECVRIIRVKGPGSLDDVGKVLGKYFANPKMTDLERNILLNDAFLRIARDVGRITATEADDAFRLLRDTRGVHALVRKCCSSNPA